MRGQIFAAVALTALLAASAADAAVVITPSAGPGTGANFNSINVGPVTSFSIGNWNFSAGVNSQVMVVNDSTGAPPLGTAGQNYLSVLGGGSIDVSFTAPVTSFSFYWGSIDSYNSITVGGNTYSGTDLQNMFPAFVDASGCQGVVNCNRYFTFSDVNGISGFSMSSTGNSFEITNISAVPEPTTWAMMILGFLGLGFLGYRKSSKAGGASFRLA